MTPNPILKVLSILATHQVRHLLMGGQACVLYGGAEFSRDTDVAVLAEPDNLERLVQALKELQADGIAVPPFSGDYLQRGHAVHFRCRHPAARGMRIDIMSVMRGVAPFDELWQRRTTIEIEAAGVCLEVMSLPDLVKAKKTKRDKDWLMIRRLMEAHYVKNRDNPSKEHVLFWLQESREPLMLLALRQRYPEEFADAVKVRSLLSLTVTNDEAGLAAALAVEEKQEREADRIYWAPLRKELEDLRLCRVRKP